MTHPPWEDRELTPREEKRQRYEEQRYEPTRCSECGENCCPPKMDVCPYCHPNTEYERQQTEADR